MECSLDKANLRTMVILFPLSPFDQKRWRYPNREWWEGKVRGGRERLREKEKWCLVCQPSSPPHFTSGRHAVLTFVGGAGGHVRVWVCMCVRSVDAKDRTSPRGVCVYCRDPVDDGSGRPCRAERPWKRPLLDERRL